MSTPHVAPQPLSFSEQVPRFLSGADAPRDFLERCIAVIERREPELQAFATLDLNAARRAADAAGARYKARGPLSAIDGLPIALKDVIETRDMPTECGSPIYKGHRAERDAPVPET